MPPSDVSRTKPLVRLLLNQIGRRLTEELDAKSRRHRLLLMLDEFPALGRLDFFEFGVRLHGRLWAQELSHRAVAPLPPLDSLSHAEKDALILALLARVEELCAWVAELEAKLGLPPKTPDNSSTPPSKGQKASAPATGKSEGKRKPHAGSLA